MTTLRGKRSVAAACALAAIGIVGVTASSRPGHHATAPGVTYSLDSVPDGRAAPNPFRGFVGSVAFAAGRGRIDVTAKSGVAPISVNGIPVLPVLANGGDYYLFDSTGFVLVRPTTKTFSSFLIADDAFSFTDSREGWPSFFDFGPMKLEAIPAGEMRLQHGPIHVYWHLESGDKTRGRLTLVDAPPGEANVARWFGMTRALAQWKVSDWGTLRSNIQLTVAIPMSPASDANSITNFIALSWASEVKHADVDLARLTLPGGFTETVWPGYERATTPPKMSPDQGARWRVAPAP